MEWVHPLFLTAMSPLGTATPVLVTHSSQSPSAPSGIPNDYRDVLTSLPKGSGGSGRSPQAWWGQRSWLVTDATSPCHPPQTVWSQPLPRILIPTRNIMSSAASLPLPCPPSTVSIPLPLGSLTPCPRIPVTQNVHAPLPSPQTPCATIPGRIFSL